jgi:hypothetical protein
VNPLAHSLIHDILRDIEREWSDELGPICFAQLKELLRRIWSSALAGFSLARLLRNTEKQRRGGHQLDLTQSAKTSCANS